MKWKREEIIKAPNLLAGILSAWFRYSYTVALKPLLSCAIEKGLSARLRMADGSVSTS
jgi:hypothetical protein